MTNASTTNLYNPTLKSWDFQLCRTLGIPTEIFPPIISTGEIYGNLLPEICEELSCPSVPVVAVATHDTASAVFNCPAKEKDFVYISCGTWSLFGTELGKPIMSEKAIAANFTNEIGYHHSVRFLKNIMGLWLIQESRRQWMREEARLASTFWKTRPWNPGLSSAILIPTRPSLRLPAIFPAGSRSTANVQGRPCLKPAARS